MANIREIQTRINSVKDTMKITNAMYMISLPKIETGEEKADRFRAVLYGLQGEISRILRHIPEIEHRYLMCGRDSKRETKDRFHCHYCG